MPIARIDPDFVQFGTVCQQFIDMFSICTVGRKVVVRANRVGQDANIDAALDSTFDRTLKLDRRNKVRRNN